MLSSYQAYLSPMELLEMERALLPFSRGTPANGVITILYLSSRKESSLFPASGGRKINQRGICKSSSSSLLFVFSPLFIPFSRPLNKKKEKAPCMGKRKKKGRESVLRKHKLSRHLRLLFPLFSRAGERCHL